ncbi:nuclear transport factor 2 family protein [Pimelobacter simplex]|uniref:Nuclear transport factor 2 family protein n=1 Tax=Nocardioides simplex TaxID=2045 RepID=A0A7J5DZ97_NOCSI|nr:nuclear transport factor 2 family protein [Pimelobacter simplex]
MIGGVPEVSTSDRAAVEAVVARFFAAFVSGPDAAERAADLRAVLLPQALVVRTDPADPAGPTTYDVEGFIAPRVALLASGTMADFREWVVAGRTDLAGDIAQHWCTYAKSWHQDGAEVTGSGTKSIQLVRTADGWRISAVAWVDDPA